MQLAAGSTVLGIAYWSLLRPSPASPQEPEKQASRIGSEQLLQGLQAEASKSSATFWNAQDKPQAANEHGGRA